MSNARARTHTMPLFSCFFFRSARVPVPGQPAVHDLLRAARVQERRELATLCASATAVAAVDRSIFIIGVLHNCVARVRTLPPR